MPLLIPRLKPTSGGHPNGDVPKGVPLEGTPRDDISEETGKSVANTQSPSISRMGFSKQSFTRIRKVTASLPSTIL